MHSVDGEYERAIMACKAAWICIKSKLGGFLECIVVTC